MKNIFNFRFINLMGIILFSTLIISLTSCLGEEGENPEPTPTAYVSLYHGSPDAPDFDILIDNQRINSQGFKYNTYSNYLNFTTGSRKIKFTPVNAANAFIDTTLTFKKDAVYSLFAINKLQNIELLVVKDTVITPASGKAGIRVVNLSPDAPAVDITTTGTNSTSLATNLNFKGYTLFTDVATGNQNLQVKKAGSNEVLLSINNLALEPGRTYSFILRGFQTPPTGNTNVLSGQLIRNY